MDDRILFNPDNRALGTSTSDFSLFGGQANPGVAPDLADPSDGGAQEEAAPEPLPSDGLVVASPLIREPIGDQGNSSPAYQGTGLGHAPLTNFSPAFHPTPVAQPGSSGSDAAGAPAPILAGAGSSNPLMDRMSADSHASDHGADAAVSPSAPAALPVEALTAPLIDGAAASQIASFVTAAVDPVSEVAHAAVSGLDGLAESIVVGATAPTGAIVDGATGAVSSVVDTTSDVVTATIGAANPDTLADLAGSDPAGGVATLVSLVSVSDMFDLHSVDAPVVDAAADPGLTMLDTLADVTPEDGGHDALLGTHDGNDGSAVDPGIDLHHTLGL